MRQVVIVAENERGLLIKDGRLIDVLEPGETCSLERFCTP